jgi:hypothetical protein
VIVSDGKIASAKRQILQPKINKLGAVTMKLKLLFETQNCGSKGQRCDIKNATLPSKIARVTTLALLSLR